MTDKLLQLKYDIADMLKALVDSVQKTELTTLSLGTTGMADEILAKVRKHYEQEIELAKKQEKERIITLLANNKDLCFDFSDEREYCAKYATCEECFRQALEEK